MHVATTTPFAPCGGGHGWRGLLLGIAVAAALAGCADDAPTEAAVRPALVVKVAPAGGTLQAYAGEVRARYEPVLAFRIGGKIATRQVEVGDRVRAGQVLATLDPGDVGLQVDAARAQLGAAQADATLARAERERYAALAARQVVSRSQFETVDTRYRAAAARVEQVRAEAEVIGNQAAYATLRAEVDGVIVERRAEAGQVIGAGQPVFVLAQDGAREIAIGVPEQRIDGFRVGQPVALELWSQPGRRYPGRIRQLAPSADAQARTFAARVAFDAATVPAELGQSARVYVQRGEQAGVSVPLAAVSADDGQPYVWTVDPATATVHRVPVTIGAYTETSVPVLTGLDAQHWVVAAGVHLLRDGQKVAPIDAGNRPLALTADAPVAAPATRVAD